MTDDYDTLIQPLNQQGWVVSDTVVTAAWRDELLALAQGLWSQNRFEAGEIGLDATTARQPKVRGDSICWIAPGSDAAAHPFFTWIAGLREVLNTRYDMGLQSQEFHFARYAAGRGYKKHIDQHRGRDHRKISVVLYLNPQWAAEDGGELCLYEPYRPAVEMQRLLPLGARIVFFVSGAIPHAVQLAQRTRWSVTGWLRTDAR